MEDAQDLKSCVLYGRVGSSPTFGINRIRCLNWRMGSSPIPGNGEKMTPLERVKARIKKESATPKPMKAAMLKVGECFVHPEMGYGYSSQIYTVLERNGLYDWNVHTTGGRVLITPFSSIVARVSQARFLEEEKKHE